MAADIQRYLDGIESQHQSKPKFMAMLKAILEKIDDATQLMNAINDAFDIEAAVGVQEDYLGDMVGVNRKIVEPDAQIESVVLDDDSFRNVIQIEVTSNQWDGTYESLIEIWKNAVGKTIPVVCIDNQDMTIEMIVSGAISTDLIALILQGYYIPKPMGVGMTIRYSGDGGEAEMFVMPANASIVYRAKGHANNYTGY